MDKVQNQSVREIFQELLSLAQEDSIVKNQIIPNIILACWAIYHHRNLVLFQGENSSPFSIIATFKGFSMFIRSWTHPYSQNLLRGRKHGRASTNREGVSNRSGNRHNEVSCWCKYSKTVKGRINLFLSSVLLPVGWQFAVCSFI